MTFFTIVFIMLSTVEHILVASRSIWLSLHMFFVFKSSKPKQSISRYPPHTLTFAHIQMHTLTLSTINEDQCRCVSADAQISADVQIHVRISAHISSHMLRSVQMLTSMCVGVSVFVCGCGCVCVCVCVWWVCGRLWARGGVGVVCACCRVGRHGMRVDGSSRCVQLRVSVCSCPCVGARLVAVCLRAL